MFIDKLSFASDQPQFGSWEESLAGHELVHKLGKGKFQPNLFKGSPSPIPVYNQKNLNQTWILSLKPT